MLLRESPAISAASSWLEEPRGHVIATCVVSVFPGFGTILALAHAATAIRFAALGGKRMNPKNGRRVKSSPKDGLCNISLDC